tara:strand:+ start:175278 stop:176420 length:1143 start_codon:yes stop_codon:yes gene_type:complete
MDKLEKKNFLFYRSPSTGKIIVRVAIKDDNIWATQKGMAIIFNTTKQNVSKHLKNIFAEGELIEDSVVNHWLTTGPDGKEYKTKVYNLDVIISLGYRIKSYEATQFRIWATSVLKEFMIKGFALDDDRLKQSRVLFGKDYFDELLARIREIRSSERRFYQKITDLYRDASTDYDKDAPSTRKFYKIVQNKLLFAVTGMTAAELINSRADSSKDNMGLMTWSSRNDGGKIVSTDITVSKNYLKEKELNELQRIVSMFLDYAENLVSREITLTMNEWTKTLDDFLNFNKYKSLDNAGKIRKSFADNVAKKEFQVFRVKQDKEYVSDFDKAIIQIKMTGSLPKSRFNAFEIEDAEIIEDEPLSDFNKKLKKGLDWNPKENKNE